MNIIILISILFRNKVLLYSLFAEWQRAVFAAVLGILKPALQPKKHSKWIDIKRKDVSKVIKSILNI